MMELKGNSPIDEATKAKIIDHFGENVTFEGNTALFSPDQFQKLTPENLKEIALLSGRMPKVREFEENEIIVLSDGTEYKATSKGWRKIK